MIGGIYIIIIILSIITLVSIGLTIFFLLKSKKDVPNQPEIINTPTPCSNTTIYENGFCRGVTGSECLMSSDCRNKDICFYGTCLSQPITSDECFSTSCSDHLVCLDSHIMLLMDYRFIIPDGWWILREGVDLTSGPYEGSLYVVTQTHLYISFSDYSLKVISSNLIRKNVVIMSLFLYRGILHALGSDYQIYRGLSNVEVRRKLQTLQEIKWEWEKITYLSGRDLSPEKIYRISLAPDNYLVLFLEGEKLTFDGNKWEQSIGVFDYELKFGTSSLEYLILEGSRLDYYYDNHLVVTLPNIRDGVITPEHNLIVITLQGTIKIFLIEEGNIKGERVLYGEGHHLRLVNGKIWLLSLTKCLQV